MLKKFAAIALLMLISVAKADQAVVVLIDGYQGSAELEIRGENFLKTELVENGSTIFLPKGNYTLMLFAMNKTFVKDLNVEENTTIKFNLLFTESREKVDLFRHVIIQPNFDVFEYLIFSNSGEENYEGDFFVSLPEHENLKISDSELSFISVKEIPRGVMFEKLIVPANTTATIRIEYRLKNANFEVENGKDRVMILTTLRASELRNMSYAGGVNYNVYVANGSSCSAVFMSSFEVSVEPGIMLSVFASSALLFLYFYSRRGGWD